MSAVEVLSALAPRNHSAVGQIRASFLAHARALKRAQAVDGRWHQLLNDTSTFLETSVTSMTLYALAAGVLNGWLEKAEFDGVIQQAWAGLSSTIQPDGTVTGICNGFGACTCGVAASCRTAHFFSLLTA